MRDDRDDRTRADYWGAEQVTRGAQPLTHETLGRLRAAQADPQGPWQRAQQRKREFLAREDGRQLHQDLGRDDAL